MVAVIQQYTFNPASNAALNDHIQETLVPPLRQMPGFVAYYWFDSGAGTGAAFGVFEEQAGLDAFLAHSTQFEDKQLAVLAGPPEISQGEIKAFAHCGL